ncbi:MAG: radical SAM protein [Candidatus Zixiibacteriota bacterium]|nr:MAG: radical SAM protein [candidate division Zixibacteria bacterium]
MRSRDGLNHLELYRLPWTLPDNAISWLEPTSACNLACDGCYRENEPHSHKPLDRLKRELETFRRLRHTDAVSIAGGDPLVHPQIVDLVHLIAQQGAKPIINTNGLALTPELLRELKRAGAFGFTFHIDSKQQRPGWKNKDEISLNDLRRHYAGMLAEAGDLCCAFNSTVYEDTLQTVPELVAWAARNIDRVHVMVFILYRAAVPDMPFDWYAGAQRIDLGTMAENLPYTSSAPRRVDMKAGEVVAALRRRFPDFAPCAYLNGTEAPDDYKWLLTCRFGDKGRIHGYAGPRFVELAQAWNHLVKGRYLSYASPRVSRRGRSMLLLSPLDAGVKRAARRWAASALANPLRLFHRLHLQSIMIIQPVDMLDNGLQSMCDGCPDMTVWDDRLVWSCRLEELKRLGGWLRAVPREEEEFATDLTDMHR